MWLYDQASGALRHNATLIATGYSGHGEGVNNPALQEVHNIGPIPRGRYTIGPAFTHPLAGPVCMRLTPDAGNQMFGRDGLMCHGDLPGGGRAASEGCVVMPHDARVAMDAGEDKGLVVV